jgi:zinc-binding alcohol dehydrogenase/oxidoreductase
MQAAILKGINQPFVIEEMEMPNVGNNEMLIQLKCSALNHRDLWIQKGQYAGLQFPIVLGSDGAGVVVQVGEHVDSQWLNKEVIIDPSINWGQNEKAQQKTYQVLGLPQNGTFAEYVLVPALNVYAKPEHLNWQEAAALPLAGITAYRSLFARGGLQKGEKVLITGIGGGVALMALQMAAAAGANVFVTSGDDEKINKAKTLGAMDGINYKTENGWKALQEKAGAFDLIIDSAAGDSFAKLIDLAAPGGRFVFYGGTNGTINNISPQKIFWKQLSILGSTMGSPTDFNNMLNFCRTHQLKPIVDSLFSLPNINAAFDKMNAGSQVGKIVVENFH